MPGIKEGYLIVVGMKIVHSFDAPDYDKAEVLASNYCIQHNIKDWNLMVKIPKEEQ